MWHDQTWKVSLYMAAVGPQGHREQGFVCRKAFFLLWRGQCSYAELLAEKHVAKKAGMAWNRLIRAFKAVLF